VTLPFFTIGHSNRSLDEFIALLGDAGVERVVDVRAFPRSRTNPQFNESTLPDALSAFGLSYEHLAALGGRRSKATPVPAEINGFWTNLSFHNYADYALSENFRTGLEHLIAEGRKRRCAIMCSEAVWWRCHRRIIADYLIARDQPVFHILGKGHVDAARLTEGAEIQAEGRVIYPTDGLPTGRLFP